MMKANVRTLLLITVVLLVGGGLYIFFKFLKSLAPADITITKTEIKSPDGFVNPVTIEKLKVDSIGKGQRPVKYTIEYVTTCGIKQKDGKPPIPLKKIKLNESGRFEWSEETLNVKVVHDDGFSNRIDSVQGPIWSRGGRKFTICPLKFEKGNWYFINFLDPQIVGIYIYMDNAGELHRYAAYSGVSPI